MNNFAALYRVADRLTVSSGRYNDAITALMLDYINRRNAIASLAAPCVAPVKAVVNAFLMKTDAAYNVYLRFDGLVRQYNAPVPGSGLFDFEKPDRVVAENLDYAQME